MTQEGKATTTRAIFSRETAIGITINATPATVWRLLTTASDYARWNSTVISVAGDISLGNTIQLVSKLDPKRVFKLKVKKFEPENSFWTELLALLPVTPQPKDGALPHPTRFIEMTGFIPGVGRKLVTQWERPRKKKAA